MNTRNESLSLQERKDSSLRIHSKNKLSAGTHLYTWERYTDKKSAKFYENMMNISTQKWILIKMKVSSRQNSEKIWNLETMQLIVLMSHLIIYHTYGILHFNFKNTHCFSGAAKEFCENWSHIGSQIWKDYFTYHSDCM